MQAKAVLSLGVMIVLCLPSLLGGFALLGNVLLRRHLGEWGPASAAAAALGVFVGGPLVAVAAMMGLVAAFSDSLSLRVKSAHLLMAGLAAIATISLLFRFVVSNSR